MARYTHQYIFTIQGLLQVTHPTTIPGTRRQTIQNALGTTLERAYLYMSPEAWRALLGLCTAAGRPASETIEQLILNAISGKLKESNDPTPNTFT